jgi:hypothetical protein
MQIPIFRTGLNVVRNGKTAVQVEFDIYAMVKLRIRAAFYMLVKISSTGKHSFSY